MEKNKAQDKNKSNIAVGVYWDDITVYHDGDIHNSTFAYTEGTLAEETKDYLLIKNPETIIVNDGETRNHPKRKPAFYYIPKSLITKIVFYGKKEGAKK